MSERLRTRIARRFLDRAVIFAAGYVAAMLISAVVTAHGHLPHRAVPDMSLKQKKRWIEKNRPHVRYVAMVGRGKPRRSHAKASQWLREELKEVERALWQATFFVPPWIRSAFLCIHRYEGAWNDPNPPYYGGLQMDMQFQRSYGARFLRQYGTADRWPPSVQIWVAYQAYRSGRGFHPWPNTARYCGLI